MLVKDVNEVEKQEVEVEGAEGVYIRRLISGRDGAPAFAMREFTAGAPSRLEPGGHTRYHAHEREHEVYILSRAGAAAGDDGETPLKPGSVVFVRPGERHNFKNTGKEPFKFFCMVPNNTG